MSKRARALAWVGLAALAVVYGALVRWTGLPHPFLDAYTPPQPYRWVSPPPEFSMHNEQPTSGEVVIQFTAGKSEPSTAFTDDGQVTVSFNPGTFMPAPGQTGVRVRILPGRPQPPSPTGLVADGNAYLIEATYVPSGQPAIPQSPVFLDFRYPGHRPDGIYRIEGGEWTPLGGITQDLLLTVDTRSLQLGTFIAGHRATAVSQQPSAWQRVGIPVVIGAAALVLLLRIAGVRFRRRR